MTAPTKQQAPAKPAAPQQQPKDSPIINKDGELLDEILANTIDRMAETADRYERALANSGTSELRRAMILASGIEKLSAVLDDKILARFMKLRGSALGFRTDLDSKPPDKQYSKEVVKECIIEGLLRGVVPLFNQMNIISGRLYITQEGYQKKVGAIPGLTDFRLMPGVPIKHPSGTMAVRIGATWRLDGLPDQLVDGEGKPGGVFAVISYQGSTPDNLIGKAKRKALKAVFEQATGSRLSDYDPEDAIPEVAAAAEKAADIIREKQAADQVSESPTDEQIAAQLPEREPGAEG